MSSVSDISNHVQQAKSVAEEASNQAIGAKSSIETSQTSAQAAVQACDEMAAQLRSLEAEDKAGQVETVKSHLEELSAAIMARHDGMEQQIESLAGLRDALDQAIAMVESIRG